MISLVNSVRLVLKMPSLFPTCSRRVNSRWAPPRSTSHRPHLWRTRSTYSSLRCKLILTLTTSLRFKTICWLILGTIILTLSFSRLTHNFEKLIRTSSHRRSVLSTWASKLQVAITSLMVCWGIRPSAKVSSLLDSSTVSKDWWSTTSKWWPGRPSRTTSTWVATTTSGVEKTNLGQNSRSRKLLKLLATLH